MIPVLLGSRLGHWPARLAAAAVAVLAVSTTSPVAASAIQPSPTGCDITIIGKIELGDPYRFLRAATTVLDRPDCLSVATVHLRSPGGHVWAAHQIGASIGVLGARTAVPRGAICASACFSIWAYGVERRSHGRLGVHRLRLIPRRGVTGSLARIATEELVEKEIVVFQQLEISPSILQKLRVTPSQRIAWLSARELVDNRRRLAQPAYCNEVVPVAREVCRERTLETLRTRARDRFHLLAERSLSVWYEKYLGRPLPPLPARRPRWL